MKEYPPLSVLDGVCRSMLPLDVAVPSNCMTRAWLLLTNATAKVSVPLTPIFELPVIRVSVPKPVPSTDSVPPVIESREVSP